MFIKALQYIQKLDLLCYVLLLFLFLLFLAVTIFRGHHSISDPCKGIGSAFKLFALSLLLFDLVLVSILLIIMESTITFLLDIHPSIHSSIYEPSTANIKTTDLQISVVMSIFVMSSTICYFGIVNLKSQKHIDSCLCTILQGTCC